MTYSGRLTLSWVNKDKALVTNGAGGYEWVDRSDAVVSEVRLLHETNAIGEISGDGGRDIDNLLISGDSLHALNTLTRLPEYAHRFVGQVKLIYIDPPFNTGQAFAQYDDSLEHSVWLTMMRDRLVFLRDLLSSDGSIWVHLDDAEMPYCRVLLDEVFGRRNFIASVIWQKVHAPKNSARHFSVDHDYLLVYAKNSDGWSPNRLPRTDYTNREFWNPDNDSRGLWRRSDLTASKPYSDGHYEVVGPHGDVFKPRANRYWAVSRETFEELRADDRLWWGKTGKTFPFRKRFLSEVADVVPTTFWEHEETGNNREAKNEITALFGRSAQFSTPKPERLISRIIQMASDPGDIVLDCFAGSGTTPAVAHKLQRRWIAIEREQSTVDNYIKPRLEKIVNGEDPGGVSSAVGWEKGGGFHVLELQPSMYEVADGHVFLAEGLSGDTFSEAVRAQLGFLAESDPPFVGRSGRVRLAVIDGVVDDRMVRGLVARLAEDERTVIVGKAAPDGAADLLRTLSPGSKLLKAPRDLIAPKGRIVR
jgi:adenine-specific DNA-methyltransferase